MQQPEDLVHLDQWTPEQQMLALKYRKLLYFEQQPYSFSPLPDDVFIAVPPKSGTTWVSHICHQLRTNGAEPDFEDQDMVVIWMDKAVQCYGLDPSTTKQPTEPRLFKTHLPYPAIPAGGKMIYCFRELKDVLVSHYHFLNTMYVLHGRVALHIFAQYGVEHGIIVKWLEDLLVWWDHRHDNNVLLLFFDDIKEDHTGCVRKIATFIGIECSEELLERVVHTTTHTEMARHSHKFSSPVLLARHLKELGERPPVEIVGKVRCDGGRSGDGKELPVEVQQYFEEKWTEVVTAKLGYKTLKDMRDAWQKEQ